MWNSGSTPTTFSVPGVVLGVVQASPCVIAETTQYGEVKLPPKAERVYGKPSKGDHAAMYLDRGGKVQTVHFRMPEAKMLISAKI